MVICLKIQRRKTWRLKKTATDLIKKNSKAFYAFARSHQRAKAKVGPFKDLTGQINPDPINTVEALKKQYSSLFSTPKPEKVFHQSSNLI